MENKILDRILQNTYTLTSLRKRIKALKEKMNIELYNLKVESKELDKEEAAWVDSLGPDFLSQFKRDDFHEVFEELDKSISALQPLVIYLAFDPGPSQIILIGAWLRQNYNKTFIFDIKIDPSLIAGCAFIWRGVYKDYSLKGRLQENQDKISSAFKSYLKTNE